MGLLRRLAPRNDKPKNCHCEENICVLRSNLTTSATAAKDCFARYSLAMTGFVVPKTIQSENLAR